MLGFSLSHYLAFLFRYGRCQIPNVFFILFLLATIAGLIISETIQFAFHIASLSLSVIAMLGATALYALSKNMGTATMNITFRIGYNKHHTKV